MKKRVLLPALICLMAMNGFVPVSENSIKKADWLLGTWENKTRRGSMYERWTRISDHEFSGKSFALKEKDTIVFETIRLVQEENNIVYIPTVRNQNEGLPVRFTSTSITHEEMIFENPDHDYPQVISYRRVGSDSLVAIISGIRDGQERSQTFAMRRCKE